MSNLNITNTFVASTTIESSKMNTNFSDVKNYVNARNDGSQKWDQIKTAGDLSVDGSATVTGTLTVGGSVISSVDADGWMSAGETWTYASSTSFTISGDKTSKYSVGDKIKLTQTTDKYFYVTAVVYGAPNTTITITGGSDYSLANAAITSPKYSKMSTPNGFPKFFNYTSTVTGFSSTSLNASQFRIDGGLVSVMFYFSGTSNSTVFYATLPVDSGSGTGDGWFSPIHGVNNGANVTTAPYVTITPSSNLMTFYTQMYQTGWTGSGSKVAAGGLSYFIA